MLPKLLKTSPAWDPSSQRSEVGSSIITQSDSDEEDRTPRRRTSARLGGCADAQRGKRRTDENKENIAPVRAVSRAVLAQEEQEAQDAIASRTRARLAHTPPRMPRQTAANADVVAAATSHTPRTPRRSSRVVSTPSSIDSSRDSPCSDMLFPQHSAATPMTTPETTPTKKGSNNDPLTTPFFAHVYAHARAMLRDHPAAPLVGRETERAKIGAFLDAWCQGDETQCLYISGMAGTGKTALVRSILDGKIAGGTMQAAVINCAGLSNPGQVAAHVLSALDLPYPDDEADNLEVLETTLRSRTVPFLLVLDEMDHLLHTRVHLNVLYRLFCMPSRLKPHMSMALIGIANALDLTERFVPLLSSRGVQLAQMQFQPMEAQDVFAAVQARIQLVEAAHIAAKPEPYMPALFARPALELFARKLTTVSGDLRRAMEAARHALEMVESEQAPASLADFSPWTAPKVQPKHILRVLSSMAGNLQVMRVRNLGVHAKLLLLAWAVLQHRTTHKLASESLQDGGTRIAALESTYHSMLAQDNAFVTPLESSELLDVMERLEAHGLVRIYAEATGGSSPQAFSKSGGVRHKTGAQRVSPSGKRAAKKQLLASNRRMAPTLDRESIIKALTTTPAVPMEQHTHTVAQAMLRLLRREEDCVARATLWRTVEPERAQIRVEELGGGRDALPPAEL
ncbi:AAA ATPase [Malassezia vespertilionis]|uniref:AAA ATPase n=1 Tax=Malassezia vespertilionis TaxID=2020962 RepID=UPI0024B1CA45|nr:AAA ATPase [Malassezia vespertilionis]WFD08282.1 AAA ATPase [Malassezia vespertilionis]